MSSFSQYPLQQAIFTTLTGDTTLMGMVAGVYDRVPENSVYPYVTLGDFSIQDWSTKTSNGTSLVMTLNVWSRDGGRKQATTIMERLYQLLHQGSLTITGQAMVSMRFVSSGIVVASDGWTYHGTIKFRALLEATA